MVSWIAALALAGSQTAGSPGSGLPEAPVKLDGAITVDGTAATIETKGAVATVLFFVAHDCPIANRYAPEIGRISAEYGETKIRFYRIYLKGMEKAKLVKQHGEDYGFKFPAVLDPKHVLVKATGVRVTPEAVVLNSEGKILYRGRIDNQNIEHGRIRPGYRKDLRVALDEVLAGKPVSMPTTAAVGCFIPDLDD